MKYNLEIEKKFLVDVDLNILPRDKEYLVETAYLATGSPEVRVARYVGIPGSYQLTIKIGSGEVRDEFIHNLPDAEGEMIYNSCKWGIEKHRIVSGRWEIDLYSSIAYSDGKPLQVAEIELGYEDKIIPPLPIGLNLIKDVTDDIAFKNAFLAKHGLPYTLDEAITRVV